MSEIAHLPSTAATSPLSGLIALAAVDRLPAVPSVEWTDFEAAMQAALRRSGLLAADSTRAPFALTAVLVDLSHERAATKRVGTGGACVRYQLYRTEDGKRLLDGVISSYPGAQSGGADARTARRGVIWTVVVDLVHQLATLNIPVPAGRYSESFTHRVSVLGASVFFVTPGCVITHSRT